jgi:glycosyltransferase involved in cell wall biosynthesis
MKSKEIRNTLVILTYNEIEGIKKLNDKIPYSKIDEYFVIDGGSTDGTLDFFAKRKVPVIFQEKKGRGEAFRIGMEKAKGENLVFFSPDGNEDPNDILKLFSLLEAGYDIAIASRFLPASRNEEDDLMFPWRAWVNRIFTFIANSFWKGKITDTINGFRGIKKSAFKKIKPTTHFFTIEYQTSIRALKLKLRVAEIATYEGNRIGGISKAKSIPVGIMFVKFLIKEFFIGLTF